MRITQLLFMISFLLFLAGCGTHQKPGERRGGGPVSDQSVNNGEADAVVEATNPIPDPGEEAEEEVNGDGPEIVFEPPKPTPAPVPTPEPTPPVVVNPDSDCYQADPFICEIELAILRQTNEYRGAGRAPLQNSKWMAYASRVWSEEQADRGRISHIGFPSARYGYLEDEFGTSGSVRFYAENVAYTGYGSGGTAEEVAELFTNMWWNSSGHRRNMLSDNTHLGVGVFVTARGYYYATQLFGTE